MPYMLKDPDSLVRHWVRDDTSAEPTGDYYEDVAVALNWLEKTQGWKVVSVDWQTQRHAGINQVLLHKD